ncbi:MAG: hypothetical protein N3A69_04340 [Leptospiraceae bacterium]|nr:hypothetical protein [Leptospiraceae bacterium]
MNATELRKKLLNLSKQPLEKLSSSDLKKINFELQFITDSLEKVEIISKVQELKENTALENKPFIEYLLTKFKTKKPQEKSPKAQWERYYKNLKNYLESCKQKRTELQKVLDRLTKAKEEEALKVLKKMNAEDKKLLSLLASLTQKKSKGVKALSIGTSQESMLLWLKELKNVRKLGVLEEPDL